MHIRQINEELHKLLESTNQLDDMVTYLKKVGSEDNGFFILHTNPEIRAWIFKRNNRIAFRCNGLDLDVEFNDSIDIKEYTKLKDTLPIDTDPEQIFKTIQKIFNDGLAEKEAKDQALRKQRIEWEKKIALAEKEWQANIEETKNIFKTLKDNGFSNFIISSDSESSNKFSGSSIEEFEKDLNNFLDYDAEIHYYGNGIDEFGLIIGDWSGIVSGTYLAGDPDNLYDLNFEDERYGDIFLSDTTFDYITKNFPNSYLTKCIRG